MRLKTMCLLLMFFCGAWGSAQNLPAVLEEIDYPQMVDTLLVRRMEYRKAKQDEGYRILIFSQSGNHSKNAAIEAKASFDFAYPEYQSYILFEEPYFKVKVGNFTSRIDAGFFLKSLKSEYPYAFIVKDVLDVKSYLELGEKKEE